MDTLVVIEQPPSIGPAVSARRYELGKTTEKRRKRDGEVPRRGMHGHICREI